MPNVTLAQAIRMALEHQRAGRLAEAESIYCQILAHDPRQGDALHLLGIVKHQAGDDQAALEWIAKAIAVNPTTAAFHNNFANVLKRLGRLEEAVAAYRMAVMLDPAMADAHRNLCGLLERMGRIAEAVAVCEALVKRQPDAPENYNILGNLLSALKRQEQAAAAYREAIRLRPEFAEAWSNLGDVLTEMGDAQALDACRRAVELRPDFAEGFNNLGNALRSMDQPTEAIQCYRRSIELNASFPQTFVNLGNALSDRGQMAEATEAYTKALALRPNAALNSIVLLHSNACEENSPEAIFEQHVAWDRAYAQKLRPAAPVFSNDRDPDRRLRVGYVSPDLRTHSVTFFLEPLLANLDRAQVETFAYADEYLRDAVTERLQALVEHWIPTTDFTDEELANRVREDRIDILVDLVGHSSRHRLLTFARKPAPVQVTWLGYPATTGMAAIDYRITDAWADPPGMTEQLHSEKLVRLPGCFLCYRPGTNLPEVAELPALTTGHITFGCFNHLSKISVSTLRVWGRLMNQVPGSTLLMKFRSAGDAETRRLLLEQFAKVGVAPERVELLPRTRSYQEHLRMYGRIDIGLDPFPYNGTTTTCEALAMGVPVLTKAGNSHVSRVGVSLMNNVGLGDWVGADDDDYVRIGTAMSQDIAKLAELRRGMRDRLRGSALCDEAGHARAMETAYRQMWRTWCEGRA